MQDLSNQGLIKAGSVVELMSGGPKMTVRCDTYPGETLVQCWWFHPTSGDLKEKQFPSSMLCYV